MLRIAASRSGHPTAYWDSYALHSTYDPKSEAERFVAQSVQPIHPDSIVLIGAGLGYLVAAAQASYPKARILGLYLSRALYESAIVKPTVCWYPGSKVPLSEFLDKTIGEIDLEGLRLMEWGPCVKRFPGRYRRIVAAFHQHIKELRGNIATSSALGTKLVRNSFANFLHIDSVGNGDFCRADIPVIIAASGPSIQRLIPGLRIAASKAQIWSLPSAVPFLLTHGIVPDLIILTDPGFYAVQHLNPARGLRIPVVMPLSAAPGIWRITDRIHLLSEDTFFERALLSGAGISCPVIPSHGTVAASALTLAQRLCRADIYVCGLDLCFSDIQSHAKPNLLDILLQLESGRLQPHYGLAYSTSENMAPLIFDGVRTSLPLQTYSGWFNRLSASSRIYRCCSSAVKIHTMTEIDGPGLRRRLEGISTEKKPHSYRAASLPSRTRRQQIAARIAEGWADLLSRRSEECRRDPLALLTDSTMTSLAYYLALPDLIQLKKLMRLRRQEEAHSKTGELLRKLENTVQSLRRKIGGGE